MFYLWTWYEDLLHLYFVLVKNLPHLYFVLGKRPYTILTKSQLYLVDALAKLGFTSTLFWINFFKDTKPTLTFQASIVSEYR